MNLRKLFVSKDDSEIIDIGMDAGISALIGAIIGSSSAIITATISSSIQRRDEHRRWFRDKKQEAYSDVLRSLFQLRYTRSGFTGEGKAFLAKDDVKLWFDAFVTLAESVSILSIFAHEEYMRNIESYFLKIRAHFDLITQSGLKESSLSIVDLIEDLEAAIKNSAIRDLGVKSASSLGF